MEIIKIYILGVKEISIVVQVSNLIYGYNEYYFDV